MLGEVQFSKVYQRTRKMPMEWKRVSGGLREFFLTYEVDLVVENRQAKEHKEELY